MEKCEGEGEVPYFLAYPKARFPVNQPTTLLSAFGFAMFFFSLYFSISFVGCGLRPVVLEGLCLLWLVCAMCPAPQKH